MGLGRHLLYIYNAESCKNGGVVIGYRSRNNREFFCRTAANVLSRIGIRVYFRAHARPTLQFFFSVKFWNTLEGIVVTARHHPKEFNGYIVYDKFGFQLILRQAKQVISYIDIVMDNRTINFTGDDSLIFMENVTDNFVLAALMQIRYAYLAAKQDLEIVYTP